MAVGDLDTLLLVVLVEHGHACERSHDGSHALLTVYEHGLSLRGPATLESDVRVFPRYEVSRWIALVERVDKLAHLRGVPNERALYLGDGDVARGYEAQYLLDGVLRDRIIVLHTLDLLFR